MAMAKQTLLTRVLLACGAVAGPIYVMVTMAQALTRDGFDLRQHRFTWLTTGDLGWIHQSNMVLVGVLMVVLALGVRQALPSTCANLSESPPLSMRRRVPQS